MLVPFLKLHLIYTFQILLICKDHIAYQCLDKVNIQCIRMKNLIKIYHAVLELISLEKL